MKCFFFSQGDYDVVINDYEKAKSLFGTTEVPVFKKGMFHLNKQMNLGELYLHVKFLCAPFCE